MPLPGPAGDGEPPCTPGPASPGGAIDPPVPAGVDAGEEAADAVAYSGRFGGKVVVVADQHVEFGQGVVADIDAPQSVRQGSGGVGDDERVTGVGFGVARIQVGNAAHREPGQIGDIVAAGPGDRDRQRTDRGGLVDHDQHRSVRREFLEHRSQPWLAVRKRCIVQPTAGRVQADGVMLTFADIETEEHAVLVQSAVSFVSSFLVHQSGIDGRQPRYDETYPPGRPCPYQRSLDAAKPGDTTPRIMEFDWGHKSCRAWRPGLLNQEPRKR
jgi:hypothetical protein